MTEPVPAFGLGRLPRITFGAGVLAEVPSIVAGHGTRMLLVTGGRSFNASPRRAELEAGLAEAGVTLVGSTVVTGEPSPSDVEGPVVR
jgi:alcohol dehydrogenase class IV